MNSLGKKLSVLVGSILGCLGTSSLDCNSVSLVLDSLGSDKSLDLGSLCVGLSTLLLRLDLSSNNEFSDIILLAQTKEFSDLGGSLWTKSLWVDNIGQAWDILLALLDDRQSKDR